jgi:hypothetical protein
MADPANDAASDGRSYASFVEVADELEWRTELLANQLLDEGGRS